MDTFEQEECISVRIHKSMSLLFITKIVLI